MYYQERHYQTLRERNLRDAQRTRAIRSPSPFPPPGLPLPTPSVSRRSPHDFQSPVKYPPPVSFRPPGTPPPTPHVSRRSPYDFRLAVQSPPPVSFKVPRHRRDFASHESPTDPTPSRVPFPSLDAKDFEHYFYVPPPSPSPSLMSSASSSPNSYHKPKKPRPKSLHLSFSAVRIQDEDPFASTPSLAESRPEAAEDANREGKFRPYSSYSQLTITPSSSRQRSDSSHEMIEEPHPNSVAEDHEMVGDVEEESFVEVDESGPQEENQKSSFLSQAIKSIRSVRSFTSLKRAAVDEPNDNNEPRKRLRKASSFRDLLAHTLDSAANAIESTLPSEYPPIPPVPPMPPLEDLPPTPPASPKKKRAGRRKRAISYKLRVMADALRPEPPEPMPNQSFLHL